MKILQLRFENLNSLAGSWHIDFTNPVFENSGIFAITGPTGSGKTTILDAICLALFGRTPRLDRVNASGNEIMTRHTGHCSAEVEFATVHGHYRCNWSQRRARGNPRGKLQQHQHEIVDAGSDTVLESKVKAVAGEVERVTGMDFHRFTRSILLAQGGFAAFLQAPVAERSELLEQMTGTEIYSRISQHVYSRYTIEKSTLESLKQSVGNLQILSTEEIDSLKNTRQKIQDETKQLSTDLTSIQSHIQNLNRLDELTKNLTTVKIEQSNSVRDRVAFEPDAIRLKSAEKARPLDGAFSQIREIRKNRKTDQNEKISLEKTCQETAITLTELKTEQTQHEKHLTESLKKESELQPVLLKVRKIDSEVTHLTSEVEKISARINERKGVQESAEANLTRFREDISRSRQKRDQHQTYRAKTCRG